MVNQHKEELKNEVFTIPNILSMLRILLIFAVVVLFFLKYYLISGIVLIVSGVTDVLDGFIARKFNMISPLGKALDPFADKLTQFAVLICLATFNLLILIPFVLTIIELISFLRYRKKSSTSSIFFIGTAITLFIIDKSFTYLSGGLSTLLVIGIILGIIDIVFIIKKNEFAPILR